MTEHQCQDISVCHDELLEALAKKRSGTRNISQRQSDDIAAKVRGMRLHIETYPRMPANSIIDMVGTRLANFCAAENPMFDRARFADEADPRRFNETGRVRR